MEKRDRVTNRIFAESNQEFRNAAFELAAERQEEPGKYMTARQASKFRRKLGIVYQSK